MVDKLYTALGGRAAFMVGNGMLEPGKRAPAFSLEASDGKKVALKDFKGKRVVLYFYPKDSTPGCTLEAQDFQRALPQLKKRNAVVLGVSRDSIASHCKFRDKYDLSFLLLSDPDNAAIEAYGAWGEKNLYGKKSIGIIRTTVVIDEDGKVKKVFPKVKVKDHVDAVLAALDED
jgi:peroxiredoxin Q/BCP